MPEALWEVQSLSKQIAEHVMHAVGAVGVRSESLDDLFNPRETVALSRGGLVVASQTCIENYSARHKTRLLQDSDQNDGLPQPEIPDAEVPQYRAELAVVSRYVMSGGRYFDEDQSAHYVFEQTSNGVWKGLKLPLAQASDNAHTEIRTYYLPKAEAVNTKSQARFVLGLCQKFDEARGKRIRTALTWDTMV